MRPGRWRSVAAGLFLLASASTMTLGCAGRMVSADRNPHGNLHAELARDGAASGPTASPPAPAVVMIERSGARAIDPIAGKQLWHYPRPVVGHPVGNDDSVILPLRGNRLVALSRDTGAVRWITQLPGEALTGLALTNAGPDTVVLAAVVDHDDGMRSRLVALSGLDASPLWERPSDVQFGAPAASGHVFVVGVQDSVVALRAMSGREVARVAVPRGDQRPLQHVRTERDGTLIAGGGNHFVNLRASTGGAAPTPQHIQMGYGVLFDDDDGLDAGFDDGERLQLALQFAGTGAAPRQAVLLSRRAVMSLRLSPDGRPLKARWVHHDQYQRQEFVAMHVGEHRVTLVREDGAIVELDAQTGAPLHTWTGMDDAQGALLLGLHDLPVPERTHAPTARQTRTMLTRLIREEDARLLPAQIVAVEMLWRSDDLGARRIVHAVAEELIGPWHTESGQQLVARAAKLRKGPWGGASPKELSQRLDTLSRRPSFLADRSVSVADAAGQVVKSGSPAMVVHLVEHLMHPATPASDLPGLVQALGQLGGPAATAGLLQFVRSYHADPEIVAESTAVVVAVDYLARWVAQGDARGDEARATLDEAYADPFTEPALRVHIERALKAIGQPGPAAAHGLASP